MKDRMSCPLAMARACATKPCQFLMEHKLGGNGDVLVVSTLENQVYGNSCGLGIHGWLEWCSGEEGDDKEDL